MTVVVSSEGEIMQDRFKAGRVTIVCWCCLSIAGLCSDTAALPRDSKDGTDAVACKGRVLDREGKPVLDASVTLYEAHWCEEHDRSDVRLVVERRTEAGGAFSLPIDENPDDFGMGYVVVRKEGFALSWIEWWVGQEQECDITLGEPRNLAGVVVDENGRPVAEAQVGVYSAVLSRGGDESDTLDRAVSTFLDVKTDAEGRFVLPNMPGEATFDFIVSKPGHAVLCTYNEESYFDKGHFSPGQADIRITLPPEAKIHGATVEKAGGRPIAGVRVTLRHTDGGDIETVKPVTSEGDGSFTLDGLMFGDYVVHVVAPHEGMADWVAEPVNVSLATGETRDTVKLELVKGAIIEVLAKDAGNGKPVADAAVLVISLGGGEWLRAQTDETGLARFRVLPGEHNIMASGADGYVSEDSPTSQIDIGDGETGRIESVLTSEARIAGIVRDPAGKPLADVMLVLLRSTCEDRDATTDPNGRFEIRWDHTWFDPNEATVMLVAKAAQLDLAAAVEVDPKTRDLDIRLQAGVTLTGRIVDRESRPIAKAKVIAIQFYPSSEDLRWQAITREDGSFEIASLPLATRYPVKVSADGYGPFEAMFDGGSRIAENRLDVGTIKLCSADLSVSGIVVDPNGRPVSGAEVVCFGWGQPERITDADEFRTDSEGRFKIDGLCAGVISLYASAGKRGHLSGGVETEGGVTDLKIVISESGEEGSFVPRKLPSLAGKPLPDLADVGVELPADANDRMLLVCLWDMNQRPSRHCIGELIRQAATLGEKGVTILAVHAGKGEEGALEQWIEQNKPPFPVGRIADDIEKTLFDWGTASLPHLILTDRKHVVIAEGFALLGGLDQRIEAGSDR
jgi:protocatechuate 3,4-dioxygenase beta subunit